MDEHETLPVESSETKYLYNIQALNLWHVCKNRGAQVDQYGFLTLFYLVTSEGREKLLPPERTLNVGNRRAA